MSNNKNDATTAAAAPAPGPATGPQKLEIPAGDKFLFVRVSAAGELVVLHSGPADALALLRVADEYMGHMIRTEILQLNTPAIATPTLNVNEILRNARKGGIGRG